mmetsp:Transcript_82815/g.257267  ORF Transcript_82815/g.257267 Transcript_82815/m.257267 type:complete len:260 (+) Transcript_82815:70-849(+)
MADLCGRLGKCRDNAITCGKHGITGAGGLALPVRLPRTAQHFHECGPPPIRSPRKRHEAPQLPLQDGEPLVHGGHQLVHLSELLHGGGLAVAALEVLGHALRGVPYSQNILGPGLLFPEPEHARLELGHADRPVAVPVQKQEELSDLVAGKTYAAAVQGVPELLVLQELHQVLLADLELRGCVLGEVPLQSAHEELQLLLRLGLVLLLLRSADLGHVVDDDARQEGKHGESADAYVGSEEDPHPRKSVRNLTSDRRPIV